MQAPLFYHANQLGVTSPKTCEIFTPCAFFNFRAKNYTPYILEWREYNKRDFVARKHGKEREPWVQKPMPFPPKSTKKKDDEEFERFAEILRPVFPRTRLTDIVKMPPYAKYTKDIITNKRKIPEAEISTMLANYTFKDGVPKNLEIREY